VSEFIRSIYGFNWASVRGRETGLSRLGLLVHPEFQSKLSEEVGGRTVSGTEELRDFGHALEQDFEELTYEARELHDAPDGRVVVVGRIYGRGRSSGLPLAGEFGHVWSFKDGQVVSVDAYMDPKMAMEEAGLRDPE
jgi:ketosteroid isomerase-like protein